VSGFTKRSPKHRASGGQAENGIPTPHAPKENRGDHRGSRKERGCASRGRNHKIIARKQSRFEKYLHFNNIWDLVFSNIYVLGYGLDEFKTGGERIQTSRRCFDGEKPTIENVFSESVPYRKTNILLSGWSEHLRN